MFGLDNILNEKSLGIGKNGVLVVKTSLTLAPFSNKDNLKNEKMCEDVINKIKEILKEPEGVEGNK